MPHTQQTDAQFPPENVEATTERPIYPTAPFRVCFALSNTAFTEVTVTCVNQRMRLHYDVTIGDACITAPFPSSWARLCGRTLSGTFSIFGQK